MRLWESYIKPGLIMEFNVKMKQMKFKNIIILTIVAIVLESIY